MRSMLMAMTCGVVMSVAAAGEGGEQSLEIKVTPNFGKASKADLLAVYRSAADTIWRHCRDCPVPPVRVRHAASGPIVLYRRAANGDLQVELSAKGQFWSQHAYQFAHEACHVLCRFKDADKTNLWFEESLCEMASLFALRQMAEEWKTKPPYPNWRSYAKSLRAYADDLMTKPERQLPEGTSFRDWWRANRAALTESHLLRDKNGIVAMQLLPLLEKQPENWAALYYLNVGRTKEATDFEEYLRRWRENCPSRLQPFVDEVRGL